MIKRLQNIFYVSGDIAKARQFYEGVLGLEPRFADGERWVQFSVAGANFALGAPAEAPPGAQGGVAVFEVDSLAQLRAKLEAHGVDIVAERDMGAHGRTFAVRDPSGNFVQFFERPKPDAAS
jgi:predicted enzyme related to lactoylglutathione lyase